MLQRLHNQPQCAHSRRASAHVSPPACGSGADAVRGTCSSTRRQSAAAASIPRRPACQPHVISHSSQRSVPLRDVEPSTRPKSAGADAASEGCSGSGAAPAQPSARQEQPGSHAHAGTSDQQPGNRSTLQRRSNNAAAHPSRRTAMASAVALLPLAELAHPEVRASPDAPSMLQQLCDAVVLSDFISGCPKQAQNRWHHADAACVLAGHQQVF